METTEHKKFGGDSLSAAFLTAAFLTSVFIGIVSTFLNPILLLAAAAAITFFALLFRDISIGFFLLIFSMPLTQQLPLPVFAEVARSGPKQGLTVTTDDFIIIALIFVLALKILTGKKKLKPCTPLSLPIIGFFSIAIFSTLISIPSLSTIQALSSFLHLFKWMEYVLIYFLVFHIIGSIEEAKRYLKALILAAILLAAGSFYLIVKGEYIDPFTSGIDPSMQIGSAGLWGIGGDKTQLAMYLIFFMMIIFIWFFYESAFKKKILYMSAGLFFFATFLFTLSRSSYLGLAIGAIAVLTAFKKKFKPVMLISIVGVITIFLLSAIPNPVSERIRGTIATEDSEYKFFGIEVDPSSGTRPVAWKYGVDMFLEKPVLGWGYYNMHFLGQGLWGGAENQYLTVLSELGLLGFSAFFLLYLKILRELKNIYARTQIEFVRKLSIGLFGGFISLMVISMFAEIFAQWRIAGPFWFLMGIIMACRYIEKAGVTPAPRC